MRSINLYRSMHLHVLSQCIILLEIVSKTLETAGCMRVGKQFRVKYIYVQFHCRYKCFVLTRTARGVIKCVCVQFLLPEIKFEAP